MHRGKVGEISETFILCIEITIFENECYLKLDSNKSILYLKFTTQYVQVLPL